MEKTLRIVLKAALKYPTTCIERFLLMATIILLPLQDHIPSVAGFSIMFIVFGVLASYVILCRVRMLNKVWLHPVFRAVYIFLGVGFFMESLHPFTSYAEILRIGQMIAGAVVIASLCRDRPALRAGIYGYIVASIWVSVLLFLTSYSTLQGATATNFDQASELRAAAYRSNPLYINLNEVAAISAQGAVAALAIALTSSTALRRSLFFGIALFCTVATSLPLSRSGLGILILSCVTVIFSSGLGRSRTILLAGMVAAGTIIWVPDAVWSRMTFSTQARQGKMEARAHVYTVAVEHFPEYMLTGVGVRNFWGPWGEHSGFAGRRGVIGAHNCFIQATIYWGLAGLLGLIAVIWQAYRYFPEYCGNDTLALSLLGVAVSVLLLTLVVHNLYAKDFSLGLGLLVGTRYWIWPTGVIRSASSEQKYLRFTFQ